MKDLEYQRQAIERLVQYSEDCILEPDSKLILFQAPTGSGKTIMLAEALSRIVKDLEGKSELAFVWISTNSLHEQSKEKLEKYFEDEKLLECITINEIKGNIIDENQIVFVNWQSLNKKGNVFMVDNERDWNLSRVIQSTKDEGKKIILIIDESHHSANTSKATGIREIIEPKLTIGVSATHKEGITNDHKVTVPLPDVVEEGMIKKEIKINSGLSHVKTNDDIIEAAIRKRKNLHKQYQEAGTNINPLLLIQIPRKKSSDVRNPEDIVKELLGKYDIKKATWLSGNEKVNLDDIEKNDNDVDVLIFKEAIALGWDCPRASLLLLQREWNADNYIFNMQTLGRIMRMPEQKHYDNYPDLNVGYVYTASNNFEITEDMARDYVSSVEMKRDNTIYKDIDLPSQFIRRKRELKRLSGDFKNCLLAAAKEKGINKDSGKINTKEIPFEKGVGLDASISKLDEKQSVAFVGELKIRKEREEVCVEYTAFIRSQSHPFTGGTRPTDIIKSSMRSLFKEKFEIDDEDKIAGIVLNPGNQNEFISLIELAKEKYEHLPERADKIIPVDNWQVPEIISIFGDYERGKIGKKFIQKSILKPFYLKKDKNEKLDWSKPEQEFIKELEKTDDDVLWWFKNGTKESKYFGIEYKMEDVSYGFYPDFIIKTKKEIIIVETKGGKNFEYETFLKFKVGQNYQKGYGGEEKIYFFMIAPGDYAAFFHELKNQNLSKFKSRYERDLVRFTLKSQEHKSKEDKELIKLYEEEFDKAQATIARLKKGSAQPELSIKIPAPFKICVLGEIADENLAREQLQNFFSKHRLKATDWEIEFINNRKLKNTNVLNKLKKGQSKYNLIVTGQIHHHSGKGNQSANLLTELQKKKYVEHIVGTLPQNVLSVDDLVEKIEEYLISSQ